MSEPVNNTEHVDGSSEPQRDQVDPRLDDPIIVVDVCALLAIIELKSQLITGHLPRSAFALLKTRRLGAILTTLPS